MFFGRHERQLDDKGRVALPAAYRPQLGDRLYLVIGPNRCIDVFPAADFEARAAELAERARRGEESDERRRSVGHSATEVTVDAQGRVKVDERLRTYARLDPQSTVVVTGGIDRVELWSPHYLADAEERSDAALAGAT